MLNPSRCIALAIATIGILVFAGHELANYIETSFNIRQLAQDTMPDHASITIVLLIYIIALAIPFVPGVEIGLLLLAIFGTKFAGIIYLATFAGLVLSFSVGRLAPGAALQKLLLSLGLSNAARILTEANDRTDDTSRRNLVERTNSPLLRRLFQYRICTLILLINTPGNTVLGGGGGIAMVAGSSGLFTFGAFAFGASIAIAPIPLVLVLLSFLEA